jgi:8-oxo-dGTP pyrophosphatase MutT (NUDIX family)
MLTSDSMGEIGAFAAVRDHFGHLLLCLRRDIHLWEMPGGHVDPGESPWVAVCREVSEETGIQVFVRRLVGVYWRPNRNALVLQFECEGVGSPTPSAETREVRFFAPDSLPEPINPVVAERIEDVLGGNPVVHMRTQTGPSGEEWSDEWQASRTQGA